MFKFGRTGIAVIITATATVALGACSSHTNVATAPPVHGSPASDPASTVPTVSLPAATTSLTGGTYVLVMKAGDSDGEIYELPTGKTTWKYIDAGRRYLAPKNAAYAPDTLHWGDVKGSSLEIGDTAGHDVTVATLAAGQKFCTPSWSSDSGRMMYGIVTTAAGSAKMYSVKADGTGSYLIKGETGTDCAGVLAANGHTIVRQPVTRLTVTTRRELIVITGSTNTVLHVGIGAQYHIQGVVAVSADGTKALITASDRTEPGNGNVYLVTLSSGKITELTHAGVAMSEDQRAMFTASGAIVVLQSNQIANSKTPYTLTSWTNAGKYVKALPSPSEGKGAEVFLLKVA